MLSDEQLDRIWTDAFRAEEAPEGSGLQVIMAATRAGGIAGLRAVEAAVRADQIEKDAALADDFKNWQGMPSVWYGASDSAIIAAAIRAQLTERQGDE